jgi:hypothetical protein
MALLMDPQASIGIVKLMTPIAGCWAAAPVVKTARMAAEARSLFIVDLRNRSYLAGKLMPNFLQPAI